MAGDQIRLTPMGGVKAFSCRNCGGQVQLLAPGQTIAAACRHCGAVADLTDENFRILSRAASAIQPTQYEIGSKCSMEGKNWVIIGMMVRIVEEYSFEWEEYLLFNPYHGFRFLAHAYGHWSWIKMVQDAPLDSAMRSQVAYGGQNFKLLTQGAAKVAYVLGEFYWQVRAGDVAETRDFVAPPKMLSVEIESGGAIWSQGEYLEPSAVTAAFGAPPRNPVARKGVGANQPNVHRQNLRRILPFWIGTIALLIGFFAFFSSTAGTETAATVSYVFPDTSEKVTPPFTLGSGMNNVEIQLNATEGLDNHWVEYEGTLHNLETNENYDFVVGAEYYYGYTDGEHWTEGSQSGEATLNLVPPGKYEMVTSSMSDALGKADLKVVRAVPIYTNLLFALLFVSILPVILIVRSNTFETRRKA